MTLISECYLLFYNYQRAMINPEDIAAAELDADFPDHYEHMAHPDDYKNVEQPFTTYIPHFRLIVRACWKISDKQYLPMSFVCDTGAPMGFYLSALARNKLKSYNRIKEDETGNEYVVLQDIGKAAVEPTPNGHAPANIVGLRVLTKLGLCLYPDGTFVLKSIQTAF